MTDKIVVLVTCGSPKEARRIARAVVEQRFAACANIVSAPVQSIYRWKGKVESAKEYLIVLKTSRGKFPSLQKEIQRLHSYDVPEIIALPVTAGSRDYLSWISESTQPAAKLRKMPNPEPPSGVSGAHSKVRDKTPPASNRSRPNSVALRSHR